MMDCEEEYEPHRAFVDLLLQEVAALDGIWKRYCEIHDEFWPNAAMYSIAKGLVAFAQESLDFGSESADISFRRAAKILEDGMKEGADSPIPDLIRSSVCDWLGRQSANPPLFDVIVSKLGPEVRAALYLADGSMPWREG